MPLSGRDAAGAAAQWHTGSTVTVSAASSRVCRTGQRTGPTSLASYAASKKACGGRSPLTAYGRESSRACSVPRAAIRGWTSQRWPECCSRSTPGLCAHSGQETPSELRQPSSKARRARHSRPFSATRSWRRWSGRGTGELSEMPVCQEAVALVHGWASSTAQLARAQARACTRPQMTPQSTPRSGAPPLQQTPLESSGQRSASAPPSSSRPQHRSTEAPISPLARRTGSTIGRILASTCRCYFMQRGNSQPRRNVPGWSTRRSLATGAAGSTGFAPHHVCVSGRLWSRWARPCDCTRRRMY